MRNVYVSGVTATGGSLRHNVSSPTGSAGVRNILETSCNGRVLVELDLYLGLDALTAMLARVHVLYDTELRTSNVLFYNNERDFVQQAGVTFLLDLSQSDIDKLRAANPNHIAVVRIDAATGLGRTILEIVYAKSAGLLAV